MLVPNKIIQSRSGIEADSRAEARMKKLNEVEKERGVIRLLAEEKKKELEIQK